MNPFLRLIQQPEYLHSLLNPLPIYGTALGIVALAISLFLRDRRSQIPALAIVFLAAASAWPVAYYGHEAYDRVLSMADPDGSAWLASHGDRADKFIWLFYLLAAVAAAALIASIRLPRLATVLVSVTLALAVICLTAAAYIAYAGGKIRHREFRNEPPPPKPLEENQ